VVEAELTFRVDARAGSPIAPVAVEPEPLPNGQTRYFGGQLDRSAEWAYRQELAKSFSLELRSHAWITCSLAWPRLAELVQRLQADVAAGLIELGSGHLTERIATETAECEWFILKPVADAHRADAMLRGFDVAGRYGGCPIVSERFREIVRAAGLVGVDFLWVTDESRFRAMQWYKAFATQPLGRGLDHPWFDPSALKGAGSFQWTDPEHRTGAWLFSNDQFKRGAGWGDPVKDALLKLFSPKALTVYTFRRVLRDNLPATDFAYVWDSNPGGRSALIGRLATFWCRAVSYARMSTRA